MNLVTVQDAIVERAKQLLPGLAQCERFAGQFGSASPNQGRVIPPAFFVAVLNAVPGKERVGTGQQALVVTFSAYCLTMNAKGAAHRASDAMTMAETFALALEEEQWGLPNHVGRAALGRGDNLYNTALDNKGFGLWAVTWEQRVIVGPGIDPEGSTVDDFLTFNADYDPASDAEGRPVTQDNVSLQED